MLKFFITVTKDLISAAILSAMLFAYVPMISGKKGRNILTAGTLAGMAAAVVIAVLKNTTKVIDKSGGTGVWNNWIFGASLAGLLVFLVMSILMNRKSTDAGGVALPCAAALMSCTFWAYALPSVLGYPFNFSLNGDSVFSTAFIYRFVGYLFGIILSVLIFLAVYQCAVRIGRSTVFVFMCTALLINGFWQFTKIVQVLHAKRIVSGHAWFTLVRYSSNYSDVFIYALLLTALIIPVMLIVKSFNVKEPYSNPAQHRKIKAKWRDTRRWSVLFVFCLVMVVLDLTAFTAIDNREVELSPVEECEIRDDALYVPLTQVEDGHLHRFAYTTDDDITVRFIVIKKPNASSYGVGLDACDICGETGYY
ncbi:MAG: DUF2318 domain-containing protein, partial [Ruminococcus sp.]|nr:DUF2318 domain-containing protein [Ruminococcus sp.]